MNVLCIAGYVGNDPVVRVSSGGTAITTFSLPIEQGWGENKKVTWVRCTLFGKKGANQPHGLTEYLTKGRFISVTGEMVLEEWESKGEKHAMVCCIVRDTKLGPESGDNTKSAAAKNAEEEVGSSPAGFDDDDIPF